MRIPRALLLLLLLLMPAPLWCGRTYRIATAPWMGWAYLDVAQAKGFWKAEGLEIQLLNHPDGATYLDALLSRKVDFTCGMVGDMVWIHTSAAPVSILLESNWSLGSDKFLVRRGRTLADLAGKPVGIYQDTFALPFFLRKALGPDFRHLAKSRFVHLSPADMAAQFKVGRLDLAVLYDPFAKDLEAHARTASTSAQPPGCIPEGLFGFRDTIAAMPAADLDALLRGVIRAITWMGEAQNDEELLKIVNQGSLQSRPIRSVEELRALKRGAPLHDRAHLGSRNQRGGGLPAFLAELQLFVQSYKPSAAQFRPADLFDPAPVQRALTR